MLPTFEDNVGDTDEPTRDRTIQQGEYRNANRMDKSETGWYVKDLERSSRSLMIKESASLTYFPLRGSLRRVSGTGAMKHPASSTGQEHQFQ